MRVYFITRFSIYDPNFRGFRITKQYDPKEYERRLFDKKRMDFKFDVFREVTFPSIINQGFKDWIWHIYISDRLPTDYKKQLFDLTKWHQNIKIFQVKDFKEFFEKTSSYDYEKPFATVRIDDDDALSPLFAEKLQKYEKNVGSVINFTDGRLAKYIHGKLKIGKKISEKNNAQGLAGIGINIYACGRHSDINERYNVIYDYSPEMFLLMCSNYTDTKRGFTFLERNIERVKYLLNMIIKELNKSHEILINIYKKYIKKLR